MADLRLLFQEMGFENIITYIQSGNVIFQSPKIKDQSEMEIKIEKAIKERFDYDVPVIIRNEKEFKEAVGKHHFNDSQIPGLCLTLLNKKPEQENIDHLQTFDYSPDLFELVDKEVFIYCPGKYHETKLGNNFFESKLKVKASTRGWKTVLKIVELFDK